MTDENKGLMPSDWNAENFWEIKVEHYTLNSGLGPFKFEAANAKLKQIQSWLKEAKDLGYGSQLSVEGQNQINNFVTEFIQKMQWLASWDLNREEAVNFKQEHDNFENEVSSFFNRAQVNLAEKYLPVLWLKAARETGGAQQLDAELKAAQKARQQADEIAQKLEADLNIIREERKKVEAGALGLGSARMAIYFEQEVGKYEEQSKFWFRCGVAVYSILSLVVVGAVILLWREAGDIPWQKIVLKAAIFAVMWYVVAFTARNYNVSSNLAAVNRHRAAVARTLEDYIKADPKWQTEMWKQGTEAMFKHLAIGYVTKSEKDQSNPIYEIINNITKAT